MLARRRKKTRSFLATSMKMSLVRKKNINHFNYAAALFSCRCCCCVVFSARCKTTTVTCKMGKKRLRNKKKVVSSCQRCVESPTSLNLRDILWIIKKSYFGWHNKANLLLRRTVKKKKYSASASTYILFLLLFLPQLLL